MKRSILLLSATLILLTNNPLIAHDDDIVGGGSNVWNQAQEPTNWWNDIKNVHGHVGPWNVLGWRMGKAALRELDAKWGQHELDIVCCVPLQTPYSCIADGLVVGTGNSIGRLDIRLAEALTESELHVSVRRKAGDGPILLVKPDGNYLERIRHAPDAQLASLARECAELPEKELFAIQKVPGPGVKK
jgi:hypothetical protein